MKKKIMRLREACDKPDLLGSRYLNVLLQLSLLCYVGMRLTKNKQSTRVQSI